MQTFLLQSSKSYPTPNRWVHLIATVVKFLINHTYQHRYHWWHWYWLCCQSLATGISRVQTPAFCRHCHWPSSTTNTVQCIYCACFVIFESSFTSQQWSFTCVWIVRLLWGGQKMASQMASEVTSEDVSPETFLGEGLDGVGAPKSLVLNSLQFINYGSKKRSLN